MEENIDQKTIPQEESLTSNKEPVEKRKEINKKILLLSAIVLFFVLFGIIIIFSIQFFLDNKTVPTTPNLTPTPLVDNTTTDSFSNYPYIQDNEIFFGGQQITDTNNNITRFVYSEDNNQIVYVAEPTVDYSVPGHKVEGSVFLLNLGQLPIKIFDRNALTDQIPERNVDMEISYSDNGEMIAITNNDGVFIFDNQGNKISEILIESSDEIYFQNLKDPKFSPNSEKIIVDLYIFEGHGQILIDLNTKEVTKLDSSGFITRNTREDWINNDTVLIYRTEQGEDESFRDPNPTYFDIASITSTESEENLIGNDIRGIHIANDKVYFLSLENDQDTWKLRNFDLVTGEIEQIVDLKLGQRDIWVSDLIYSKKLNMFFIGGSDAGAKDLIYRVDLNQETPEVILWRKDADLNYNRNRE